MPNRLRYDAIANVCNPHPSGVAYLPRESTVAIEIVMPRLSDSMEEGTILQWLVAEGDVVAEGEPLVEVETDKVQAAIEAPIDGTLRQRAAA